MIIRCGRCQTQFQVPGPGRYACPSCGTGNEVRPAAAPPGAGGPGGPGGLVGGPSPAGLAPEPPAEPSPRAQCPACGFSFIVGDIDVAVCPNCGAEVATGAGE